MGGVSACPCLDTFNKLFSLRAFVYAHVRLCVCVCACACARARAHVGEARACVCAACGTRSTAPGAGAGGAHIAIYARAAFQGRAPEYPVYPHTPCPPTRVKGALPQMDPVIETPSRRVRSGRMRARHVGAIRPG